ncbi:MAG: ABC-three component system middle component 6 [Pseudomonadota bacterium]
MILPTKHLRPERALITVGAEMLVKLKRPATVSRLWDDIRKDRSSDNDQASITYDWFVLALDMLFIIGAVTYERGVLRRTQQ